VEAGAGTAGRRCSCARDGARTDGEPALGARLRHLRRTADPVVHRHAAAVAVSFRCPAPFIRFRAPSSPSRLLQQAQTGAGGASPRGRVAGRGLCDIVDGRRVTRQSSPRTSRSQRLEPTVPSAPSRNPPSRTQRSTR
jgi:hypothetical protein